MSAKHAILGLVIERPGYGYQLAQRLEERFGSSAFAPSGVYAALDQLARDGYVCAAGEIGSGPARRAAPRTIYEATDEGVAHFEDWMLSSSPAPPLRDELLMKISLCRPRDVPRLIETVYGQELVCGGRLRDLQRAAEEERAPAGRATQDAAAGSGGGASAGEPSRSRRDRSQQMRMLARDAEIALWSARIVWLQSARQLLEPLRGQSRRPSAPVASGVRLSSRPRLRDERSLTAHR